MKTQEVPDIDVVRASLALGFEAYRRDTFRFAQRNLAGMTHLIASRKGLYAANEEEWVQLAYGFFFGITFAGSDILLFESCDEPHSSLHMGRIVRLTREGDRLLSATVVAKGLDNGCHQIDQMSGDLYVVDTYNQMLQCFAAGSKTPETLTPLPTSPTGRWDNTDARYAHVNSILRVGDRNLLLLHNSSEHTGRRSELDLYDLEWNRLERWTLAGGGCHGLALLEDGTLLTCDSIRGHLIGTSGLRVEVSPLMTRGLAVGTDSVVVGASALARREHRLNSSGTLTFMDRDYHVRRVLDLPCAPTEVRRLDGEDFGLSAYLEQVPWGGSIREEKPVGA